MNLILTKGWAGKEELISDNPTEKQIVELLNTLDWQQFNSVKLERDSKNWIDVSGNIGQDGLAIVYEEQGNQYISDEAPESITQLKEALSSYLRGEESYKKLGDTSETERAHSLTNNETSYDLRKIQYEAKRKRNKRNHLIRIVAAFLIISFFSSIFYLWYTDDLKFIGHETEQITAKVTDTKWKAVSNGFIQLVTYEFNFEGSPYKGHFKGNKFTGKHKLGDIVRVKFAIDDPTISKRIATVKRKKNI